MAPRRAFFQRKLYTFYVTQDRIVHAVFLLVCLVAVYLLVMSFVLLSEVRNRMKVQQRLQFQQQEARRADDNWANISAALDLVDTSTTTTAFPDYDADVPVKTILLWNPFFSDPSYHFGIGRRPFVKHRCPINTCRTTTNRSYAVDADAVVFHTPVVDLFPEIRLIRRPNQIYVFLQREPHYPKSKQLLDSFYDAFNLTVSYRYDSDIVIPYGRIVPRTNLSEPYNEYPPETKTAQIVWVVSHCNSLGRREMYIDELRKYADVDIYGDCGNLTCDKSDNMGCYHRFETQYKYYISFENTYCKDYVSEKLYRSLLFDMVPIVYGKANYSGLSPPHSVIDIQDFPKPKMLADYLWYLDENPQEYSKYFLWKKTHDIVQSREEIFAPAFCRLCDILHDPNYLYRDYRNITAWWLDGTCELGYMAKTRKNHHW